MSLVFGVSGKVVENIAIYLDRQKANKTLHMDTDDLSRELYNGILIEAEKLTHDLTLHYGLLSYGCKNEAEYIVEADKLTREIMEMEYSELDSLFSGDPPNKEGLDSTLRIILKNIEKSSLFRSKNENFIFKYYLEIL